ncbi:glycerophosphodiester phosphodiesterase family protein [Flectobacillus major]|uniref:glycerophosphodiester phosphodiesterase family protein n=1 Tax=Flectobacillus major TaxID=103 RepID=UPI0004025B43|nr:glycerophosphodiester phosphodiesterase family protein [Flectobacillus major]
MIFLHKQSFDLEGHRGCRGLMPENTIPAFLKALEYGVDTLELDVCISQDSEVVVSHEPFMNSLFCTKPTGEAVRKSEEKSLNLFRMNYNEIRQFDSGLRGNRLFPEQYPLPTYKPLLKEMLLACEQYIQANNLPLVKYNIEIKSEEKEYGISQPKNIATFCNLVFAELQSIASNRIIVQSFDFNILRFCKQQIESGVYPKVILSALVTYEGVRPSLAKLGFVPDIFSPYFKALTKGRVAICHQKGIRVVPWTVNEPSDMLKVKNLGADGLITDYPDRAVLLNIR